MQRGRVVRVPSIGPRVEVAPFFYLSGRLVIVSDSTVVEQIFFGSIQNHYLTELN